MTPHGSVIRYVFRGTGISPIVAADFGEILLDHPDRPAEQQSANFASLGFGYASPQALGGATRPISFTVLRKHANLVAALTYCRTQDLLRSGFNVTGMLTEEIQNGPTFQYSDAVLLSSPTKPYDLDASQTVTVYRFVVGEMTPVSGLPWEPGLKWSWIMQPLSTITTPWGQM